MHSHLTSKQLACTPVDLKKKKRLGPGFDRTKGAVAAAKYQLPEAQPAPHTQKKKKVK